MRIFKVYLITVLIASILIILFSSLYSDDEVLVHDTTIKNTSHVIDHHNIANHAIPKIVHQEWKTEELPPNMKIWRDDCIRINPGWEFKLWTKDENLKLVEEHYPELLDLYNGYERGIKRIDMIRFLYLHKFGGVYMDLDIACMKPFGSLFDDYPDKFIVVNQFKKQREYTNAFMVAPKGHELFDDVFRELPRQKDKNVIEATGGLLLQYHVLIKTINKGKWVAMPFDLFYAQDWLQSLKESYNICNSYDVCRRKYPNAITVHMWAGTWAGGSASNREWQDSDNIPITNYNITTKLQTKYISLESLIKICVGNAFGKGG